MRHLLLGLALLTLFAARTLALPDDRNQAIEISAAKAVRDEKAGFTIYTGDVILEQGSLQIAADKLTIFHDREAADRIVAVGEPARLRQRPAADKGIVTASAGRIEYLKSAERVLLLRDATIEQDGAVVTGESIDYLMAEQRVRANASPDDESARVQVIIPAEVIEDENRSGDNSEQNPQPPTDPGSVEDSPAGDPGDPDTGDGEPAPDTGGGANAESTENGNTQGP